MYVSYSLLYDGLNMIDPDKFWQIYDMVRNNLPDQSNYVIMKKTEEYFERLQQSQSDCSLKHSPQVSDTGDSNEREDHTH